jgi:dethiobiotin synthetase
MRGIFITGTDTGVGKTHLGCALIRALLDRGAPVRARKPVESGCARRRGELLPADATSLRAAAGNRDAVNVVCPFPLEAPLAPSRAAALAGQSLTLAQLLAACRRDVGAADFLVVEGAGGFLSPLTGDALNADLARGLGLPVLLVAADRLGAMHQVLATAEAILRRDLPLAAVILNQIEPHRDPRLDNAAELARWLDTTIVALPYQSTATPLPPLGALARELLRDR